MARVEERRVPEDPIAVLELQLIRAYIAGAGYDLRELLGRTDEEARRLLAAAARYAAARLAEVEARSHYLHNLHGQP